jgi:hypothetical protein
MIPSIIPTIVDTIRLIFSRIFLRAILGLVILIFIASVLPVARGIYDHFFPRPELRITESSPSQESHAGNEKLYRFEAVVENRGNSTAEHVYVSASLPGGQIKRYEVFADYPYTETQNTDTSRGYLLLGLERLSPGARITVHLWGSRGELVQSSRVFAAVYDAGSAPGTEELSSEERIRGFIDEILTNLEESRDWVIDKTLGPEEGRDHQLTFGDISIPIPQIPSHLAISAITLGFLAWLFLSPTPTALVHGGLVSGICWLTVSPTVIPSKFMVLCTLPFFLLGLRKEPKSRSMLSLSGLFLLFILIDAIGIWPTTRDVTDCITAGYLTAMLSLALLP